MENVKNIGMKCNQKQFDKIKPKLKKENIHIFLISDFKYNCYLYHFPGQGVTNVIAIARKDKEIHEQWNEKIFLEACGIFEEPKFEITKEQILHIHEKTSVSNQEELQEWFPEAFETVLQVGKWYKSSKYLICKQERSNGFGFYLEYMCWIEEVSHEEKEHVSSGYVEATTKEVTEALKNEAVKRGFKENTYFLDSNNETFLLRKDMSDGYFFNENKLYLYGWEIFCNGKWTEIIPTKTIKEAEELLKELGHNFKIV